MQPDGMARLSAAPPPAAATQIAKSGSQRDLVRKVDPTTAAGSVRRPARHSAVRLRALQRTGTAFDYEALKVAPRCRY